jgi:hypothetical protein
MLNKEKKCDKPVEHLSFRVLLVEGLFSVGQKVKEKYVNVGGMHLTT